MATHLFRCRAVLAGWGHLQDAQYFFTPNFHNSSLDVVISFGVPGLFGYALMVIGSACVVFNRTITAARRRLLLLGMLVLFTISSCFDFQFMRHNGMPSLVLFYLMFLTGKARQAGASLTGRRRSFARRSASGPNC